VEIGSEEHKQLFCNSLIASHQVYQPEDFDWIPLEGEMLQRLQGIPFWDEALYTERKAGVMLQTYAERVADPLIREAIALQAMEEERHGRLIQHLIHRYQVNVPPQLERPIPADIEPAFIKFGYGECFDSFFAFGLFELARQADAMPAAFFNIFDPILDEEARHMLFFINWYAYRQVQSGQGAWRGFNSLWQYTGALQRRLDALWGMGKSKKQGAPSKKGFTATGAQAFKLNLSLETFLQTCIEANHQRMSGYDQRLLRPEFIPVMATLALQTVRLLPTRKPRSLEEAA